MAFVAADWSIDRQTGNIRYIGDDHGGASPSYATVIEFHRALQDFADNASSSGDDELDITDDSPSDRSTDNIITLLGSYNIDDAASEHLYDGSIIQSSGAEIYDGIVNFGNAVTIQIIQNGAVITDDWWNNDPQGNSLGLNSDPVAGISHRFMVKVRTGGADIDGRRLIGTSRTFNKVYSEFGISASSRGNNVLALSESNDLNNATAAGTVAAYTVSKVEGYQLLDIPADGSSDPFYIQWDRESEANNNAVYEYAKYITRDGSTTQLFGLDGELFRGITHQVPYTSLTNTFTEGQTVTIDSDSARQGQIIADDGSANMWIQMLRGAAPSSGESLSEGTASATAGTVVERSIPAASIVGVSTGAALIGAYGVGFDPAKATKDDDFTDLNEQLVEAPNNVTFTVSGIITEQDRVLVGPTATANSTVIQTNQFALNATLNTANVSSIVVTTTIPSDSPSTGFIRVQDDDGFYRRIKYSSRSGSTFTVDTTYHGSADPNNPNNTTANDFDTVAATAANNVWIAYIDDIADATAIAATALVNGTEYVIESVGTTDFTAIGASANTVGIVFTATGAGTGTGTAKPNNTSASFTVVYSADQNLVVRVRDGGASPIKEFLSPAVLGTAGGSSTAIRTSDA